MNPSVLRTIDTGDTSAAATIDSPLGPLRLLFFQDALCGLYLPSHKSGNDPAPAGARGAAGDRQHRQPAGGLLARVRAQLDEYFAGKRAVFDVPLRLFGTEFQRAVWGALLHIPSGQTRTYGELAREIGAPRAARAVGAANGQNPVSILVPCHRVIGTGGALTGYAGGIECKRWLLLHERQFASGASPQRALPV